MADRGAALKLPNIGLQGGYSQQHNYSRGFQHPTVKMDRSSKENINKDIAALKNALVKMDLIDIYRAFHSKEAKYTFFSNAQGTFSKIDNTIGHKISPNKFKKIEIISSIFSDQKGLKLETNIKENKNSKTLKLMEIEYHGIKQ